MIYLQNAISQVYVVIRMGGAVAAKNAMEVFAVLDKSNCRKCGEKTCLAFAGAVFLGERRIEECPTIDPRDRERFRVESESVASADSEQEEYVNALREALIKCDFHEVAERIAGHCGDEELRVAVLGKKFGVDTSGRFVTDLHVLPWVVIPVLDYMLHCKGLSITGNWISFREITGGKEKYALFKKRGEDVLKHLADKYTDFFSDIVHMFSGQTVAKQFESDVSVVLYPLPLVPVMICYWKAEEGMGSSLNLFFDSTVNDNLGLESAFFLGTGLAQMLEKIAEHHGF